MKHNPAPFAPGLGTGVGGVKVFNFKIYENFNILKFFEIL
jgi:hypothetical protein